MYMHLYAFKKKGCSSLTMDTKGHICSITGTTCPHLLASVLEYSQFRVTFSLLFLSSIHRKFSHRMPRITRKCRSLLDTPCMLHRQSLKWIYSPNSFEVNGLCEILSMLPRERHAQKCHCLKTSILRRV